MRQLPALLVALVFVVATGVPAAGSQPMPAQIGTADPPLQSITTVENTTNQLTIPDNEVSRSTYNTTGVDIGTATEAWSTQLRHRHEAISFEDRFQRADSSRQRTQLVMNRVSAIEDRQQTLDRRQDRAIRQYANGQISAQEFLRTRLVVDAEATELLESLDRVAAAPNAAPGYTLSDSVTVRLRTVEGELRALTGPLGNRLQSSITDTDTAPFYLEVSTDAYMLAGVTGDQYVRETRLDDARSPASPDRFLSAARNDGDPETSRLDVADERAAELYPWLYQRQRPSFTFYGTSGIYEFTATHPNGELATYLDGGTTDVFYETQFRELSSVRSTATEQSVNGTLQVTVRQSTETGPLLVSATNNETGAPVDGRVSIGEQRVGSTGADGILWTVEPRGGYDVTVTTDAGRTTVAVPAA